MKLIGLIVLAVSCFGVAASHTQVAATPKSVSSTVQTKTKSVVKKAVFAKRNQRRKNTKAIILADPSALVPRFPPPHLPEASSPVFELRVQPLDVAKLTALLNESKKNKRPLLINFWATWCVPCREEFPDLVMIDKKYNAQGLDFFTVSADDATEIATTVPQFLLEVKAHKIPAYLIDSAESEQAINLIDTTWSGALPTTFLFDRTGKLVFKHSGRVNLAKLEMEIKKVVKEREQEAENAMP